jgi:hypothetical protein
LADDKLKDLGPFARVMRMPQLMFVPHDRNLAAEMRRFRIASKQSRDEQKRKNFEKLNPPEK